MDATLEDIILGQARCQEQVDKVKANDQQVGGDMEQQEGTIKEIKGELGGAIAGAHKMQFNYHHDQKMFELKKENAGKIPPGEEVELEPINAM